MSVKFSSYKSRAKREGLEFTIPEVMFTYLLSRECYYCKSKDKVGIDRIDNSDGYISGNCISSCWTCNRAKSNSSAYDFVEYLKRFNSKLGIRYNPRVWTWDDGIARFETVVFDRDVPSDETLQVLDYISRKKKEMKERT